MPHALSVRTLDVSEAERDAYLRRLAERRASALACGTQFWAFEQEERRGRFLEFVETRDRGALATALAQDALVAESLDFRFPPSRAESEARAEIFLELAPPSDPV